MGNINDKRDRELLSDYATSIAVDREMANRGSYQLDMAVSDAQKAKEYLDREIELKQRLVNLLDRASAEGMTESIANEIDFVSEQLSNLNSPESHKYEHIKTQDISGSFEDMKQSNIEFAKQYDIDLSNPFMAMFSGIEQGVIANELTEKFDLLRLDKYDYAFASCIGIIGGIVDAVFIGTASRDTGKSGQLVQFTDNVFDKMVENYARLNGWGGPKKGSDPTKSAIGFLERNFTVGYDAARSKDTGYVVQGLTPSNHHLMSLSHSPLGLVIGVLDILQGKSTFYQAGKGIIRVDATEKFKGNQAQEILTAVHRWFGHCMSDVAGASGSVERGAGLPTGLQSILQQFQFGKIPVNEKNGVNVEYDTIGNAVSKMYQNGFDLRFSTATAIPVIVCESLVRIYWVCKQYFYYGKSLQDSLEIKKCREAQRLLLVNSLCFSTIDISHALVKGTLEENPIAFLNSLNYVQLANLGYKLWANFRLEHEHNEKVRELMQGEIRVKLNELINS